MADITITAGNVAVASTSTRVQCVEFGETVTAGLFVYRSVTDGLYYKSDAAGSISSRVVGMVIIGGAANAIGVIAIGGNVSVGAVLTAGVTYFQSETAAKMCPRADLTTPSYVSPIGTAATTTVFQIASTPTGIQL